MRVVHIIAGLRPQDGGPAYSVPRLCDSLGAAGLSIELMSVSEGTYQYKPEENYCDRRFGWDYSRVPVARALRASSGLQNALRRASHGTDVIHNHGLWLLPNVYAGREAARARRPLVISPRGMLSSIALSFSKWRKRVLWQLAQKHAVNVAACFHATSMQEYNDIRAMGLPQPVAVIPNGIDVDHAEKGGCRRPDGDRIVLSLGRMHAKKGLDTLLRAWAKVEANHPDWRLRIAGPSEGQYDAILRNLAHGLQLSRASIEGPLYGADKKRAYENSNLFVLSSRNENFGLTAAEALASGVPVIATRGTPWSGLKDENCGWWTDHGEDALATALADALRRPSSELQEMGERGRAWMLRDFSWDRAGHDMADVYRWMLNSRDKPAFVQIH